MGWQISLPTNLCNDPYTALLGAFFISIAYSSAPIWVVTMHKPLSGHKLLLELCWNNRISDKLCEVTSKLMILCWDTDFLAAIYVHEGVNVSLSLV